MGNAKQSLRIALLNSADQAGGAETVVRALRDGLLARQHDVKLWVGRRVAENDGEKRTFSIARTDDNRATAARFARKGFYGLGLPHSPVFCNSAEIRTADIVHLHNLHGHYLSITDVPRLAGSARLVWTLHDFFPLTGGCAFPEDCPGWLGTCGECPQVGHYPLSGPYDRTRRLQRIKRRTFRDLPVAIVVPSRHLEAAVHRSGAFRNADVHRIPYGVDTARFRPARAAARTVLGVAPDRPAVLLIAQGLDDPRKGLSYAAEALARVDVPNLVVLLVGGGDEASLSAVLERHEVRRLGYLTEQTELARCFAAADLMIFTSLAENFPCVVMEAMACGTAVLAFAIDGVTEQIDAGRTGFLVPPRDVAALSETATRQLLRLEPLRRVGDAARNYAEVHWRLQGFVSAHERLYEKLLAERLSGQHLSDDRPRDPSRSINEFTAGEAFRSIPCAPARQL